MTVDELKFEIAQRVFAQMGLPTDSAEHHDLEMQIQLLREQLINWPTESKQD